MAIEIHFLSRPQSRTNCALRYVFRESRPETFSYTVRANVPKGIPEQFPFIRVLIAPFPPSAHFLFCGILTESSSLGKDIGSGGVPSVGVASFMGTMLWSDIESRQWQAILTKTSSSASRQIRQPQSRSRKYSTCARLSPLSRQSRMWRNHKLLTKFELMRGVYTDEV